MELKIYTEQMKDGQPISIEGSALTSSFLPKEPELSFEDTIYLKGEAYLAGDHLIIRLTTTLSAWVPCCICNQPVKVPISLSNFYHAEPLEEIRSGIFDFSEILRSDLLLELPRFAECEGKCPEREGIKKFLKEDKPSSSKHAQFPFSNL